MWKIAAVIVSLLTVSVTNAQNEVSGKLNVYIDCRVGCDFNYFKSEINIVNFVLDMTSADVRVLLTAQTAGSGGVQYQMNFYGQKQYRKYSDTLVFNTLPNATPSDVRNAILQYLMHKAF